MINKSAIFGKVKAAEDQTRKRGKSFSGKLKSVMMVIGMAAVLAVGSKGITTSAASDAEGSLPAGDLVRRTAPEMEQGEPMVIDDYAPSPLNSAGLNMDAKVGLHYEVLTEYEKRLYRAYYNCASKIYTNSTKPANNDPCMVLIDVGADDYHLPSNEDYFDVIQALSYDHPDMAQFVLCSYRYRGTTVTYLKDGRSRYNVYAYMTPAVAGYDQNTFNAMTNAIQAKRASILSRPEIASATGTLAKELAIHDYLVKNVTYDYNCLNAHTAYHIGHTAYAGICLGTCVCDGYAESYEYLLAGANINAMVIGGEVLGEDGGGHAWSIVEVAGGWYEVDVTWDDSDKAGAASMSKDEFARKHHNYYHLTTAQISNYNGVKRERDDCFNNAPKATSTTYSYANVVSKINSGADFTLKPVTGITVSPASLQKNVGVTGTLTATVAPTNATNKTVFWRSSDPTVVEIDASGHYKTLKAGYSEIVAVSNDGLVSSAPVPVTVLNANGTIPVGEIALSVSQISGKPRATGIIGCSVKPANATNKNLICESSNDDVVTIAPEGGGFRYTLKKHGTAGLTIRSADGAEVSRVMVIVEAIQVAVTFNCNGGWGYVSPINVYVGEDYGTLPNSVRRDGYTFDGWYTDPAGGVKVTDKSPVEAETDHVLYAHWIKNPVLPLSPGSSIYASGGRYKVVSAETGAATASYKTPDNKRAKNASIPASITDVNGTPYTVVKISAGAFSKNTRLKSVAIPSTITVIGKNAFKGCKNLSNITLNANTLNTVQSGAFKGISGKAKFHITARDKSTYKKLVKKLKKAGAKKASFKYKKG